MNNKFKALSEMKLSLRILLLYGAIFFSAMQIMAQSPCEEFSLPQEKVMVHLDRNVCLAGETIWFKAWCLLDGQLGEELSKVLYLEVFDETQKIIVREKYLLNNNQAAGSISIPEDVPSKYYFLKAYTRYMRNFSHDDYHYQQITIVNPLIEGESVSTKEGKADNKQMIAPTQPSARPLAVKHLQIKLDKDQYQSREPIKFHLVSAQPLTADLSTTVRWQGLGNRPNESVLMQNEWLQASCDRDPFCRQFYPEQPPYSDSSNSQDPKKVIPTDIDDLQWRPETRGLTITGVIQDEANENIGGASTLVAALQKDPMLYMGTTDEDGTFTICLHHMQQQKNLFVGTPDEKNRVLVRNDFDPQFPKISPVPLQFDSTFHKLLESLYLHQQLKRVYPENTSRNVFQPKPLPITSTNIVSPDRRIVLSDFISLPTMTEVFRDITSGASLQEKEGRVSLSVFNYEQQKYFNSPLILLDNVPVFDIPKLLEIEPSKVEAIEIYDSNYILGAYSIGGIISIITKTDDFAGYKWGEQVAFTSFKAFAIPQTFEQVVHQEKSHYPDFRSVLYWNPDVQLEQQEISETTTIFAPDRAGMYEVLVRGYTQSGEPCLGYMTFEVVGGR